MRFGACSSLRKRKRSLHSRHSVVLLRACLIFCLAMSELVIAQEGGFFAGVVRDRSGTVVAGAEVQIQNEATGARQQIFCNAQGQYASSELTPGIYKITIRAHAFRTATQTGMAVQPGQTRTADFVIELLPLQQEITVQSTRDDSDPAGNGIAVSRQSSTSTLPENGRDLHAFYAMVPGSTVTPAASGDGGQFSVNGQRPNTNTVRIDGISGNTGLGVSATPGTYPGSSLPGMTVIGSTQDLASKDEIDRVELRSSDFAPEYGDRPGAQIRVETRSGSNEFHGSAFAYIRPAWLDSTDWFAQNYSYPLRPASLNGSGASLGGALFPNRTFFFLAFEDVKVNDTALQLMPVPSMSARAAATNSYALLLNAFPLPAGPNLNANESLGMVPLEKQASVENYSARIDQSLGHMGHLFARYTNVPSRSTTEQLSTTNADFRWVTATLGATMQWGSAIHDFRANFSRVTDTSSWAADSDREQVAFDALANPFRETIVISGADGGSFIFEEPAGITALSIAGLGQLDSGDAERTHQDQWEGTYIFTKQFGLHNFRAGADYIRLTPRTTLGNIFNTSIVASGVEGLLQGNPLGVALSEGKPIIYNGQIVVGSLFAQDTYKLSDRLSILYGLRWEITPPSNTQSSTNSLIVGPWSGPGTTFNAAVELGDLNHSKWPMHYNQIAPRFGLAYLFKRSNVVFRAGAGVFYDDALGSLLFAVNLSPLNMWQYLPTSNNAGSTQFESFSEPPPLSLPKVWEWRSSIEKPLEGRSTISLAYVGSAGCNLLRLDGTVDPTNGILQDTVFTSYGASDYDALQAQFTGNLTPNLYALVSYTWAHSIDTGSIGSAVFLVSPGSSDVDDRGSSNFDVRHNLNASFSYRIPSWRSSGLLRTWLNGWNLSSTLQARTGFPIDITSVDRSIGLGFANTGRPDLVYGVPIWVNNSSAPGGRELNPAAFIPVSGITNGTLGRNILTGPGLLQIDASLRRQFRLFERASLETSINAYNLFNQADFSNPVGYLGSALFGQSISMQSLMLGSGTPTNGITPIFQSGGPRTVEFMLKFSF